LNKEIGFGVEPLLSCSLTGIIRATLGVNNALPLVHGPMSCSSGHRPIPLQAGQEPLVATTTLTDIDLVRGTSEKLDESIKQLYEIYKPRVIVVILTCATSLINEYYELMLGNLADELGCLILNVDGSAMAGNEVEGYRFLTEAIEKRLKPKSTIKNIPDNAVCIKGLSPTDYGVVNDLDLLTNILERSNCQVSGTFFLNFEPEKDANLFQHVPIHVGWLWTEGDEWRPAPYGIAGTQHWIEGVNRLTGFNLDDELKKEIENSATRLNELCKISRFEEISVGIEGLSWWTIGLARFLKEELGCSILISTDQAGAEYQQKYGSVADITLIDTGNYELLTYLDDFQPQVVFGSSYVKDGPWHWIPFYQPVWHPSDETSGLMGASGALKIARQLADVGYMYA